MKENRKFIDLLISKEIITEKTLQSLLIKYQNNIFDVLLHLVQENIADKDKLGKLWGDSVGIAYIDLDKAIFQVGVVEKLPEDFARKNKIIPIYQFGKGITIATANPTNSFILDKVEQVLECQVSPMFAFPDDIDNAIEVQYSSNKSLEDLAKKISINAKSKTEAHSESQLGYLKGCKELDNESKWNGYKPAAINFSKEELEKLEFKSVIPEITKKYLVDNTKEIFNEAFENRIPKPETCDKIRNAIIEEVENKIDVIFCIRQLRINDELTYAHTVNVSMMSAVIGKMMGFSPNVLKELTLGAFLHDVGKMRIPKKVLYKAGKLESHEIELIKKHTVLGHQITKMMGMHDKVADIVLNHHERMDGKGYPQGIKGEEISLNTQIVSIVDVYDSLLSNKMYKGEGISHHEAINIMLLEGQKAFCSNILYKFVGLSYNQEVGHVKNLFKSVVYGDIL